MPAAKPAGVAKKVPAKKAAPKIEPPPRDIAIWFIGNFAPPHSTENHVARAFRSQVGLLEEVQESDPTCWDKMTEGIHGGARPDFILWTRTNWGRDDRSAQLRFLLAAAHAHVPVIGYHLDIWWGLAREQEVSTEPFFCVDLLITADGGHDDRWEAANVNHVWFPPAVSAPEAVTGFPIDHYRSKLAFVGNHSGGYHQEHQHRHELVSWLRTNFRNECRFWPEMGQPAVRGQDLQDLYASVDVVLGDSCFAGTGLPLYWSDRIPETLGRGGLLVHPGVPGLEKHFNEIEYDEPVTYDNGHLITWDAGDWEMLGEVIQWTLALDPAERSAIKSRAREHVLANHTYEIRMGQLIELLAERGFIR